MICWVRPDGLKSWAFLEMWTFGKSQEPPIKQIQCPGTFYICPDFHTFWPNSSVLADSTLTSTWVKPENYDLLLMFPWDQIATPRKCTASVVLYFPNNRRLRFMLHGTGNVLDCVPHCNIYIFFKKSEGQASGLHMSINSFGCKWWRQLPWAQANEITWSQLNNSCLMPSRNMFKKYPELVSNARNPRNSGLSGHR